MRRGIFFCMMIFAMIALVYSSANAQGIKKNTLEDQLSQIILSQKNIEQRLTALENRQNTLMNALGAFSSVLRAGQGGMPGAAGAGGGCGAPGGAGNFPPPEDFNKVYKIDVGQSPVNGKKDAKITIVEFSDYQCPFSQRFHPVVTEVLKAYPNDVKYILKNFPLGFHPQAKPAVKAAMAAGIQGKYWEMSDLLFQNGKELTEDKFKELAKQIGLDVDKFVKDYKDRDAEWEKLIQADMAVASEANVGGTPTFFVNGKKTMARDLQGFKNEIDAILKGPAKK